MEPAIFFPFVHLFLTAIHSQALKKIHNSPQGENLNRREEEIKKKLSSIKKHDCFLNRT